MLFLIQRGMDSLGYCICHCILLFKNNIEDRGIIRPYINT